LSSIDCSWWPAIGTFSAPSGGGRTISSRNCKGATADGGLPWFVDVTAASAIDFQHFDSKPHGLLPEMYGQRRAPGFDYDTTLARLFCPGGPLLPSRGQAASRPIGKLYRNNGDARFIDVTEQFSLARAALGIGLRRRRFR